MSLIKDPDQRRKEQWEKTAQAQRGWNCAKMLGFGDLGGPPLSAAEEYSLHSRYIGIQIWSMDKYMPCIIEFSFHGLSVNL